jgi:diguanylate cyclase (GGDEF)-like protein
MIAAVKGLPSPHSGRAPAYMIQPSPYQCSLLVVDDEPYILSALAAFLGNEFDVLTADSVEEAQRRFCEREIDLVLTDQKMPHSSGVQLLEWVNEHSPRTIRLMMTGFADLGEAVDAINKGQVYRYLFKPWKPDELLGVLRSAARTFTLERSNAQLVVELQQLNERLREMNAELERRVEERTRALQEAYQELEQKNKMLEKLALTDPLTNLPNRRAMDRLAERELRRRDRYPGPLAILLVDVDHFKSINERYLLPGGDKVLTDIARVLSGSIRTVDFVGRIGGEEFMVIAPQTNMEGAATLGERIRAAVEQASFSYKDEPISVRVSLGGAVVDAEHETDYDSLKHWASAALAEAKHTGRNRCVHYSLGQPPPFEQAG